ncbi:Voltage-gated potassium channel [Phytophthora cactorum]|nr:Voltage-gated potassium channel [Phytophthora cactorum]
MLLLAVIGIICASVEGELLGVELAQLVEEGRDISSSLSYSTVFIVLKGVLSGTSGLLLYALIMRYQIPFESSLILLTIDWLLTSVALNFFERASNPTETNASDAFWLTIVTITGVGYGDSFPWTLGGKIIIAIGGIIGGMVIACLLRVILIDTLQLSPKNKRCSTSHSHRAKKASTSSSQKIRLYAAAEACRLLRFAQPPSLAGDTYSNSLFSSQSDASVTDFVTKRTEYLRESIQDRCTRSCHELERTKDLFRSIAASS